MICERDLNVLKVMAQNGTETEKRALVNVIMHFTPKHMHLASGSTWYDMRCPGCKKTFWRLQVLLNFAHVADKH